MPINEAAGFRRSNLTREQKRQAEAAIYGLQETFVAPNQPSITPEDIERMRAIIAQHDKGQEKTREFDLNNPPEKPYHHQEFPRLMYHHGKRIHRVANSEQEMQAAIDAGWKKEPFPPEGAEPEQPELDPETALEAAAVDAKLKAKRK